MSDFIPYGRQSVDEEDIAAVVDVLRSDWITQGPAVERFERALADYCGAEYAVAVANGTAALHLACLAAGVGPGDKVVTSPITFVASANCVLYCGGEPAFVDIDPKTINIDTTRLAALITSGASQINNNYKAVIPVHFAGLPCDMESIGKTARDNGLAVIEDASHALGAEYRRADGAWVKVGACRDSDMTTFSFHPVKPITTGEGGAVTTNSEELYEKLKVLRTHGITKEPEAFLDTKAAFRPGSGGVARAVNGWYYEMQQLGYNYRITDLQCALGLSQLTKLDGWTARRREIAAQYDEAFAGLESIHMPDRIAGAKSAYHLYVIKVKNRDHLFSRLRDRGIGAQIHYIPVHLQPYYRERFGYKAGDFPAAEAYFDQCISIPIYPKMAQGDVDSVIAAVKDVSGS